MASGGLRAPNHHRGKSLMRAVTPEQPPSPPFAMLHAVYAKILFQAI